MADAHFPGSRNGKRLLHIGGIVITLLALAWFARELVHSAGTFPDLGPAGFNAVVLCTGLFTIPALIAGLVWYYLLRLVGEPAVRPLQAVSINCLAQAGKYLPGNVAHYIGRVLLAREAGWGTANTLFTIFIETLWSVGTAAALALLAGIWAGEQLFLDLPRVPQWQLLTAVAAAALLLPVAGHRLFQAAARRWATRQGLAFRSLRTPPPGSIVLILCVYICSYLIMGWVLAIIAEQVFGVVPIPVFLFAGCYAVAWVTGLITPGAPAGLGVREVILTAVLTPFYGSEIAVGITAALRVVTVAGDGLVALTGLVLRFWTNTRLSERC